MLLPEMIWKNHAIWDKTKDRHWEPVNVTKRIVFWFFLQMHEVFRTIKLSNTTTIEQPSINLPEVRKFPLFEGEDPWVRWCYPAKAPRSPPGGVQLLLGLVKHLNEASKNYGKNGFINHFNHTQFRLLSELSHKNKKHYLSKSIQTPVGRILSMKNAPMRLGKDWQPLSDQDDSQP